MLTSPFTPMLFMGEEWGARTPFLYFTDHQDPELAEAVRNGRRKEFSGHGWADMYPEEAVEGELEVPDPQDPATVRRSRLDWDEHTGGGHLRLLRWYRLLIALRADVADLHSGDLAATAVDWDTGFRSWVVVHRGDVRVVMNLADAPATVPVPGAGTLGVLAEWDPVTVHDDAVELPAKSVVVLGAGHRAGAL